MNSSNISWRETQSDREIVSKLPVNTPRLIKKKSNEADKKWSCWNKRHVPALDFTGPAEISSVGLSTSVRTRLVFFHSPERVPSVHPSVSRGSPTAVVYPGDDDNDEARAKKPDRPVALIHRDRTK